MPTFVYAHGFKSASRSRKATQLRQYLETHRLPIAYRCPDLSFRPSTALAQLSACCEDVSVDDLVVFGSSLGGFYAVALAERLGCKAVLLNPSVRPFETLAHHLGEQTNLYTGEKFVFDVSHIAELKAMHVAEISRPERYLLMVETGDEVLDYRMAVARFQGARQIVVDGGDHELRSFADHLPEILSFSI